MRSTILIFDQQLKVLLSTSSWSELKNNKLHEIKPELGGNKLSFHSRRDQVVITRCRIGHSRTTHDYLLKNEPQPECIPCDSKYTIKHVLLDCIDLTDIRKKYFSHNNMFDLSDNTPSDDIVNFLKEISLYNKI